MPDPVITERDQLSLQEYIPRRSATPFRRVGIQTLADAIRAIRAHGLRVVPFPTGQFRFGPTGPHVRGAGPVAWVDLLEMLRERGFAWWTFLNAGRSRRRVRDRQRRR